jgi:phage I-like protein
MDDDAVAEVLEAFETHGTDIVIDYEHQSLGGSYASPNGQAPAAGWIQRLWTVRPEEAEASAGLWAEVRWTEAAREKLAAKEYRYLSPVVVVRKSDRRVIGLHSAALTNKPAIVGMRPIVNAAGPQSEPAESEVESEAMLALREQLAVSADANVEQVIQAARDRLAVLETRTAEIAANERVTAAMRSGKLTPAQRAWAMDLAMKDPSGFDAWVSCAPVVVQVGRTVSPAASNTDPEARRAAVIASARASYASEPLLAQLTSLEAWEAEVVRSQASEDERQEG